MFIFYFLGVGPPCRSVLCQFWLCEEAQCVYLCRHLGSPLPMLFIEDPLLQFILRKDVKEQNYKTEINFVSLHFSSMAFKYDGL